MKRRTFIRCLTGFASGIACLKKFEVIDEQFMHQEFEKTSCGYIMHGKSGGCSTPGCTDSSSVQFEQALHELESRRK
jgi:hypothetical protein